MVMSRLLILKHYNNRLMHKEALIHYAFLEMGKKTFPEGEGSIRLSMVITGNHDFQRLKTTSLPTFLEHITFGFNTTKINILEG